MAERKAVACLLLALVDDDDDENGKRKRGPTRNWIKRREEEGIYSNLVQELLVEDTVTYREMMRMDFDCFKKILEIIEPEITPKSSGVPGQRVVSSAERLVLTIRFLATGESFNSLNFNFEYQKELYHTLLIRWQKL